MLKIFIIFSESLSMLMWLHIGFRRYIEQSRGKILFCVLYVFYYYLTSIYGRNVIVDVIPAILILVWTKFQFRETKINTLIKFFISAIGMGISQLLSIWLISIFYKMINISEIGLLIEGSIISLLLSTILYVITKKNKKESIKYDVYIVLLLTYIIVLLVYLKNYYQEHFGLYGGLYLIFITTLFGFIMVAFKGLNAHYELEQKRIELEMKEAYDEVYSSLLLEMRRKQHDYKNQISALYSIQLANDSKEELIKLQREYGDKLLKSGKYDNLILGCSNPVLSGYVYTKCNEAERLGISIEPNIMCTKTNYNIGIHEIIEILGILINNALEYLADEDLEYKSIKIDIFEKKDKLHIDVSNVAEYVSYEKIEKMFTSGYSTKGEGRGLGLDSLKNIVQNNKGELMVENIQDKNNNWLQIKVII